MSSLGLAACGVSATINQAVSSIGASPNLQVNFTASVAGAGSAKIESVLSALSLNLNYASTNNASLAQSAGNVSSEFTIVDGGHTLFDLRQVATNLYLQVNVTALSSIPGVNIPATQLLGLQLLFQGRWFEVSAAQLRSLLPANATSATPTSKEQAMGRAVVDALSSLIEKTPHTTLANGGYSETGKLSSVADAVLPILKQYSSAAPAPSHVKGTYSLAFTMSGATATGASLAITVPDTANGSATIALRASLTHNSVPIVVPTGATLITPALITQLLGQVHGTALPLG